VVDAYLSKIGLPHEAIIYIIKAASNEMTWLNISDAAQRGVTAFVRGRIVSGMKTDFATGPNKALYATLPRKCTRRCATPAVWNDCGKIPFDE
jgi:hypothetical protein